MNAVSPIGSTADSPLKSYTSHGNGLSANYGAANLGYEAGGALRLHAAILPGSDPFSRTKGVYNKGSASGDLHSGSSSGGGSLYNPTNGPTNPMMEKKYMDMVVGPRV